MSNELPEGEWEVLASSSSAKNQRLVSIALSYAGLRAADTLRFSPGDKAREIRKRLTPRTQARILKHRDVVTRLGYVTNELLDREERKGGE